MFRNQTRSTTEARNRGEQLEAFRASNEHETWRCDFQRNSYTPQGIRPIQRSKPPIPFGKLGDRFMQIVGSEIGP